MDKTDLRDLVCDDRERGLFRVHRSTFTDVDVWAREQRLIFAKSWLYVGHESEIRKPGDFVTRKVGGQPVIFLRDRQGAVQVLLNSCSHRGNIVCREKAGNARSFSCFYHAWTYSTTGELVGLPDEAAYAPAFERKDFGLKRPPRVESYRGLVFLNHDAEAVGLVEYFGNARESLDMMLDYSGDELEIVRGQQSYSMRANWKLLVENSIDAYHGLPTHQRYFGQFLSAMGSDNNGLMSGVDPTESYARAFDNGHALIENYAGGLLPIGDAARAELDKVRRNLEDRFGTERARLIADFSRNLFIFPNLIFVANWRTIRTFFPVAPDYMEVEAWGLMPMGEPPEVRQQRQDNLISFLGPAGFGTPDDVEALEGCQSGFATIREQAWSDISRGMKREQAVSSDELQMRSFWRRWRAMMLEEVGATNTSDLPDPVVSGHRP